MLLHNGDLLRAEIVGLLSKVTADDKEQLSVSLQELDFAVVELAVLLQLT